MKTLTLMGDYCSSGLWLDGPMVTSEYLNISDELSLQIKNWINDWDSYYTANICFDFDDSISTDQIEEVNDKFFRIKNVAEQYRIAKKLKIELSEYKIVVFDDIKLHNEEEARVEIK
jgi:hypothetical protein